MKNTRRKLYGQKTRIEEWSDGKNRIMYNLILIAYSGNTGNSSFNILGLESTLTKVIRL